MTYVLTDEQNELAAAVRQLTLKHATPPRVRDAADAGRSPLDRDTWRRFAEELGIAGLLVAEEDGGVGSGLLDAAVVLEETATSLDSAPLLSAFIASALLADTDDFADVRQSIAEGSVIPAVAWVPDLDVAAGGELDLGGVLFGADADLVVILTDTALAVAGAGVRRDALRSIDLTRSAARLRVDAADVRTIPLDAAAASYAAAIVAVLVSSDLVGALRGALAQLRDYADVRTAFGRIIGSFQGVKHQLADLAIAVEVGQTLVRAAVAGIENGEHTDAFAAAWYVSEQALSGTANTVRLHGGIGYTWEYDAQLWYRRVRGDQALLGPRGRIAARLDAAIGIAG